MADRNYVAEITEALHASDAQRLARIALELFGRAARDEERRAKDAARKRNVRGNPRTSAESTESADMRSSSSNTPLVLTTNTDYSANVRGIRGHEGVEEHVLKSIDLLRGSVGDEDFRAVDEFIGRRPYRNWKGWLDEMLACVGPGSQYTPADLVRVCKDDAALERPIGSPRGLRAFLLSARVERVRDREGLPVRRGGVGQRSFDNATEALKDIPEAS